MYLFVEVTFFDDVRIKFYFSTFELRTEIAFKLKKIINSQSLLNSLSQTNAYIKTMAMNKILMEEKNRSFALEI